MFIQSFLFFILGVAFTTWLLVLFSPLIWRKAIHFAREYVCTKFPLSYTEVQANYDFLCAKHAVELAHNEQKYNFLQKKYAQQKIQLSQITEQLYRLCLSTQSANSSAKAATTTEQNIITTNTFMMEIKTMREKIANYQQRLQNIQTNALDTTKNLQLLHELREEIKELAATLTAQIALKEGEASPINRLIQKSKSKDDLASRIRKKITNIKKNSLHKLFF
ncbi:small-conductance mechanosensitive channel [Bartonella silvatica]|uniref:Small-conductance mechanosensitive channel n=1 Tax=Bartonella silvatica TaxID=357760 RepID=A0ABV2HH19_9HYPH